MVPRGLASPLGLNTMDDGYPSALGDGISAIDETMTVRMSRCDISIGKGYVATLNPFYPFLALKLTKPREVIDHPVLLRPLSCPRQARTSTSKSRRSWP